MQRSDARVITTHVGSLPRPLELVAASRRTDRYDERYVELLETAVVDVVAQQVECGLDVIDDGQFSKPDFMTYINQRVDGIELDPPKSTAEPVSFWEGSREVLAFPEYYRRLGEQQAEVVNAFEGEARCVAPLRYTGQTQLERDIDNLKAAAARAGASELFMPSISVTEAQGIFRNEYYATEEEQLYAIADIPHEEYAAIVGAGLLLQVDDPGLVTQWVMTPNWSVEEMRRWVETQVDAINHGLRGIPEDRVRFHTCYSIDVGPRLDLELKHVVDLMLEVNAGAYSFEAANPPHEHEWRVWEDVKLPEGKLLIPGVITHSTVLVEHPEVVADRIVRFAEAVGRENVIAGADCGFSSIAGAEAVDANIAWAKLSALVAGAELATVRLWGTA
jgi:5-methyltetrahydropteroyltriglutamate--homocysteine methyltransferase